MRKKLYICDFCGAESDATDSVAELDVYKMHAPVSWPAIVTDPKRDICQPCATKIGYLQPENEEKSE